MKQTKALAMINGGYFDKNNQPTGLLISNGRTWELLTTVLAVCWQLMHMEMQAYDL